jgi:cellulose synthase/poly-beta-1,6-N-acetylglucosamine synthase-like glycosyltransferase
MIIIYFFIVLYVVAMLFILLYSLAQGHLLFHFLRYHQRPVPSVELPKGQLPLVTIQLPVYNERYVVERLISAVAAFNYPPEKLEIQLLDDSTDETQQLILNKIREFPQLDIKYLHRMDRTGYKAGALREGLSVAKGEFIAIFDADFVPDPDFLYKTLPHFKEPKIGMVQSRWTHLNKDYSLLTQLQAFALDAHFLVEQIGRNRQNAFINFNGTGGIWRKSCILDAGNWEEDTLTEDLDLSYRAQQRGWHFIYRPEIESPAELPPIMSAIKSQQYRWTKGGAECAVKHFKAVWKKPFPLRIKFHAMAHLFNSFIFMAVLVGSISSIPLWWAAQQGFIDSFYFKYGAVSLIGFVIIALVYITAYFYTQGNFWDKLKGFIWQLPLFLSVSMGLSLHNSRAVWQGLRGKRTSFVRTPKFNLIETGDSSWNKNLYITFSLPVITYLEGGMGLLFMVMAGISIYYQIYEMLPFHIMLSIGYTLVFYTSIMSYKGMG